MNTDPSQEYALETTGLTRRFGHVAALRGVSVRVRPGSVHGLVGQNGAGKSTLIGILSGRIRPTSGQVSLFGDEIEYGNPRAIARSGLATIYQELTVVPGLTVAANVFLGHPIARSGWLFEGSMRKRVAEVGASLGVSIPPDARAGSLSVADQQLVEIMRALVLNPRVILLDEPTASLSMSERRSLLEAIGRLRDRGISFILISHNLDEVLSVSDDITVMRDGQAVATGAVTDWDRHRLVKAMLGEAYAQIGQAEEGATAERGKVSGDSTSTGGATGPGQTTVLAVNRLAVAGALDDVSLHVEAGEIVGIAGLVGSGRTTLLRTLAGLERSATGQLTIRGQTRGLPRSPREARSLGISLLPEDRKAQGLVLDLPAAENVMLGSHRALGITSPGRMRREAREPARRNGFDTRRLDEPARNFSGGNQQKLLLARAMSAPVAVLLADEPTRGIDIHAKGEIYQSLGQAAQEGLAVIVVSSELEELITVCTRIYVLARKRSVAEIHRGTKEWTVRHIIEHAFDTDAPRPAAMAEGGK